jgi:UPF0716 protein FxsA
MGRLLFATFIIVPIIEIALFVLLGDIIGFWWTMAGVLITAVIGSVLLRWQGFRVVARIREALNQGSFPARPIIDGVMLAVAGALLLTPGFFTDTIGFLLFIPAVRTAVFGFVRARVTVLSSTRTEARRRGYGSIELGDDDWRDNAGGGR